MCKKIYTVFLLLVLFFGLSASLSCKSVETYFQTSDYEEYEQFLRDEELSDCFVSYEDISYLGRFSSFMLGDSSKASYNYSLISFSEKELYLHCDEGEKSGHAEILLNESKDLRHYWNTVSGTVIINEVGFRYTKGKLTSIRWWTDGCSFVLSGDFSSYPYVEGDFICQLLMRDTAEDAIEVLLGRKEYTPPQPSTDTVTDTATDTATTDAIPSGGENASFPWLWIALPVGVVVIAGGAAFVLIRKKRKATPTP